VDLLVDLALFFLFESVGFKIFFNMLFKWINYTFNYVDPGLNAKATAKDTERTSALVVVTVS
jgi:hypothetical protein